MTQQDLAVLEEIGLKRPKAIQIANDKSRMDYERQFAFQFLVDCHTVVDNMQDRWALEANWA